MPQRLNILALGASAHTETGEHPLAIELEFKQLELLAGQASVASRVALTCRLGVSLDELTSLFSRNQPHVVILSGHLGRGGGVVFQRNDGHTCLDSGPTALLEIFKRAGSSLQVLVLNVCDGVTLAQQLAEFLPVTVGMAGKISDPAARTFSHAFVEALAYAHPLETCFQSGIRALFGNGMAPAAEQPAMFARAGLDGLRTQVLQPGQSLLDQLQLEQRLADLQPFRIALAVPPDLEPEGAAVRELVLRLARSQGISLGFRVMVESWSAVTALADPPRFSIFLFWSMLAEREDDEAAVRATLERLTPTESPESAPVFALFRRRLAPTLEAEERMLQVSRLLRRLKEIQTPLLEDQGLTELTIQETLAPRLLAELRRHGRVFEEASQPTSEVDSAADFARALTQYLETTLEQHRHLPLIGVNPELRLTLGVDDIYVPLRARLERELVHAQRWHSEHLTGMDGLEPTDADIDLQQAFVLARERRRRGVVVLGDPGSGKTTLLKLLLVRCLQDGGTSLGLPEQVVPVMLPLRELRGDKSLDTFFQRVLDEAEHFHLPKHFVRWLRNHRPLLFLLDGLDEVPDEAERARVSRWIRKALDAYPNAYFGVTSRFAGYIGKARFDDQFLELQVRPLEPGEARALIGNFYRVVENFQQGGSPHAVRLAEKKSAELWALLCSDQHRTRRMRELQTNPLLLTILCLVHQRFNALPDERWRLYELCLETLLYHWRKAIGLEMPFERLEDARRLLLPVAHWLHQVDKRRQASADELVDAMAEPLKQLNVSPERLRQFLKDVRDRSGLLVGWGADRYGFIHLAFQEHLTAKYLQVCSHGNGEVLDEAARRFGESWWTEVILLLVSLPEPCLFEPFMRRVLAKDTFALAEHRALLADCVADASVKSPVPFLEVIADDSRSDDARLAAMWALRGLRNEQADRVVEVCRPLVHSPNSAIRAQALELLEARGVRSSLQKPELGSVWVHLTTGLEFVYVPPGSFMMGSDKYPSEQPIHRVTFARGFWIGKYPVTNEQYRRFLNATGHRVPRYWGDRQFNGELQPVVGVDWDDAGAYCQWANVSLLADRAVHPPALEVVKLPSEAVWEYAARGPKNLDYPWGIEEPSLELANFGKHVGRTTPVGQQLRGASWVGAKDMAGNVWEWCYDPWHPHYLSAPCEGEPWLTEPAVPEYFKRDEAEPHKFRVARGGSWSHNEFWVRSAYRGWWPAKYRFKDLGFRVMASALPGGET